MFHQEGSHAAGFLIQGVHLVGKEEDPELALSKFRPCFQDVGKQKGQSTIIIKPKQVFKKTFNYK